MTPCRAKWITKRGASDIECEATRPHPLSTVRVDQMCPTCAKKKAHRDGKLVLLKDGIKKLRADLSKGRSKPPEPQTESSVAEAVEMEGSVARALSKSEPEHSCTGREPVSHATEISDKSTAEANSEPLVPSVVEISAAVRPATRRSDLFVGGICLASTLLMTKDGKLLS